MREELVEKLRAVIASTVDIVNDTEDGPYLDNAVEVARACLAEIEAAGMVVVPRGALAMLFEVHLQNPEGDDWAVNIGARPNLWHDQGAYVQAWDSLRSVLAGK